MIRNMLIYIIFYLAGALPSWALADSSQAPNKTIPPTSGMSTLGIADAAASTRPPSPFPAPPLAPRLDCLIEPNKMVDLATSVSGIVKFVNVDRGDIIKAGQVLAQLEAEVEKANVAHSSARVEFASKKYRRMQELYKEQMVSAQQMEEAKTENDLAVAELRKASEMLHQRTVLSPFHGVVVERYVSPGELVEGKKVIKVAQINPLRVEVIVPIALLGEFKMGAKMQVVPEGPVAGPFEATVHLVDRVIDAPSGTFRVRLALPNPNHQISAGVRCKAQFAPIKVTTPKTKAVAVERPVVPAARAAGRQPQSKLITPKVESSQAESPRPTPKMITPKAAPSNKPATDAAPTAQTQEAKTVPKNSEPSTAVTAETPQTAPKTESPQATPTPGPETRETIPSGYGPDS